MNTQRTSAAVWVILVVAIVIDIAGRRVMPDPVRFDALVGGVTGVLFLIFDQRVCVDCGHEGQAFMFMLYRWL